MQIRNWLGRHLFAVFFIWGGNSLAAEPIYLACVDCYGTSSFYPQASWELQRDLGVAPGQEIRWIHIQTEAKIQDSYISHFEATKNHYVETLTCNVKDPASLQATTELLRQRGIKRAVGGMETGTIWSDFFNRKLGYPGNDPDTSHLRREKLPMQQALGDLSIDSIFTRSRAEMVEFAARQTSQYIVMKPNASSGAEHVNFIPRNRPDLLWSTAFEIIGTQDKYGHEIDGLVFQPAIRGPEYAANTIARNGHVTLTALWRYEKFRVSSTRQVYFIDRPIDLTSPVAREIASLVGDVHHRLHNLQGPGHTEFVWDEDNHRWYVFEQGARVGGSGMSMIDEQVWGTSHLKLNLLSILDANVYDREIAKFPRRKLQEAATVDFIGRKAGWFRPGAMERVRSLSTFYSAADYFEAKDGVRLDGPTEDMKSSPATVNLTGPAHIVQMEAKQLVNWQTDGTLFEYDKPASLGSRCRDALAGFAHNLRMHKRFRQIRWNE